MNKLLYCLVVTLCLTASSFSQNFMSKSQIMLSLQYIRSFERYEGSYSFIDIQGDIHYSWDTATFTGNTIIPCAYLTSSLFNTGDSKVFFGDYEGFSMGLGHTSSSTKFRKATIKDGAMAGHLGFLFGLSLGWNIHEDYEIGARYYYDFQWWIMTVGDDFCEMTPFTNNLQFMGRWKSFQADLTLGGRMKHYNSRKNIQYTTINFRKLINDDQDKYLGLRLDFFDSTDKLYQSEFRKYFSSIGLTIGWTLG